VANLDVNGNSLLCGIIAGKKIFLGCSYNNLYVFNTGSNFSKIAKLETKEFIHKFISIADDLICCGQKNGHIQLIKVSTAKIILSV